MTAHKFDLAAPAIEDNIIRRCVARYGGGMAIENSAVPLIDGNTIEDCEASGDGGGMRFDHAGADTIVRNNVISLNRATGNEDAGGGVHVFLSDPLLFEDNVIDENEAYVGGGVYMSKTSGTFKRCKIANNTATYRGGGVYLASFTQSVDAIMQDCEVTGNSAIRGGGIYAESPATMTLTFIGCTISVNHATVGTAGAHNGGGLAFVQPGTAPLNFALINCKVLNNEAVSSGSNAAQGGGIYADRWTGTLINTVVGQGNSAKQGGGIYFNGITSTPLSIYGATVADNVADDQGGGLYLNGSATTVVTVKNSIFWGNTEAGNPSVTNNIHNVGTSTVIRYSDAEGGDDFFTGGTVDFDNTNIGDDPDDAPGFLGPDYRIPFGFGASDRGNSDEDYLLTDPYDLDEDQNTSERWPRDLANVNRRNDDPFVTATGAGASPYVDMGAYEAVLAPCSSPGTYNRFIAFVVPDEEETPEEPEHEYSIRVTLTSLHHPPSPENPPDLSPYEGQVRYVVPYKTCQGGYESGDFECESQADCAARSLCETYFGVTTLPCTTLSDCYAHAIACTPAGGTCTEQPDCPSSSSFDTSFKCAKLGCEAYEYDWGTALDGEPLVVTGSEIVPSSIYTVELIPASSSTATAPYTVSTCLWGDVDNSGVAGATDIADVIDVVKDESANVLPEYQTMLNSWVGGEDPIVEPLFRKVNALDIARAVDAARALPYPHSNMRVCP